MATNTTGLAKGQMQMGFDRAVDQVEALVIMTPEQRLDAIDVYVNAGLKNADAYLLTQTAQQIKVIGIASVLAIGEKLALAKKTAIHGTWGIFLESCGFSEGTAANYLNIWRKFSDDPEIVNILKPAALYALAAPKADKQVVEAIVTEAKAAVAEGKPAPSVAEVKQRLTPTADTGTQDPATLWTENLFPGYQIQDQNGKWWYIISYNDKNTKTAAHAVYIEGNWFTHLKPGDAKTIRAGLPEDRMYGRAIESWKNGGQPNWKLDGTFATGPRSEMEAVNPFAPAPAAHDEDDFLPETPTTATVIPFPSSNGHTPTVLEHAIAQDDDYLPPAVEATYLNNPQPQATPRPLAATEPSQSEEARIFGPETRTAQEIAQDRIIGWLVENELLREMILLHMARQPEGTDTIDVQLPDAEVIAQHAGDALVGLLKHVAALGAVTA